MLGGGQDRAEGLIAGHRGVPQPHGSGDAGPGQPGTLRGSVERAQRQRCLFEECPAGGGERDLPAVAHEQVGAEDALQIADLVAQRGLRDVEARRCPAEVQLLRDSKEIAQQPRLEIHSRKLSPARRTGLGRPPSPAS